MAMEDSSMMSPADIAALTRGNTVVVKYNGEEKPLIVLCRELGINYSTVRKRLSTGMSVEEALSRPADKRYSRTKI